VRALITENGYPQLTVDAVAARAKVGKAAIYRRFSSRAELVFASLVHDRRPEPLPDTGSLRGDLDALANVVLKSLSDPVIAAAMPGLMADVSQHPDIGQRFQQGFVNAESAQVSAIVRRAVERGEASADSDPRLVHAMMLGTVFAWIFLLGRKPVARMAKQVAGLIAHALRPS